MGFPVMLELAGRLVVVVGAGPVGLRKARAAVAASAVVRVIDPTVGPTSEPGITWIPEVYQPDLLAGASLVFACATPAVNARVVADARIRGLWVNTASDPDTGDFHVPAVVRAGGLTVAVSTGGAAPALARRVREKLAAEFDDTFAAWVYLLNEIRAEVLATVPDANRRRELLEGFADWPWLSRLRAEGIEPVRAAMREVMQGQGRGR